LYFGGAAESIQRADELYQKPIAYGVHFSAFVFIQGGTNQFSVFLQQLQRKPFILLREGGKTDHVRKHDRGRPALSTKLLRIHHCPLVSFIG
jgi:hypothetical protein